MPIASSESLVGPMPSVTPSNSPFWSFLKPLAMESTLVPASSAVRRIPVSRSVLMPVFSDSFDAASAASMAFFM